MRIALATSEALRTLNPGERRLAKKLAAMGIEAKAAVWDDPAVHWAGFDAVLVRTCWDYHLKLSAFLAWLDRIEPLTRLWNPPEALRWNLDKIYLRELSSMGIPVPASVWLDPAEAADVPAILAAKGWRRAVVKPRVSASAHGLWVAGPGPLRLPALDPGGRGLLVQDYLEEVASRGEWSLIYFGGEFSHAVLKRPAPGDFRVQTEHGGTTEAAEPEQPWIELGQKLLARLPWPLLYARLDGVEVRGGFTLMELELIEPELFLGAEAAERFARQIRVSLGS